MDLEPTGSQRLGAARVCSAEREGAYRFVENEAVLPDAVGRPIYLATARRCAPFPYMFVAVDQTSLTLTDRTKGKGFGPVGTIRASAQGIQVMNAMAVCPQGAPVGLCNQIYWARSKKPKKKGHKTLNDRAILKETRHWVDSIVTVSRESFESEWPAIDREERRRGSRKQVLSPVASLVRSAEESSEETGAR